MHRNRVWIGGVRQLILFWWYSIKADPVCYIQKRETTGPTNDKNVPCHLSLQRTYTIKLLSHESGSCRSRKETARDAVFHGRSGRSCVVATLPARGAAVSPQLRSFRPAHVSDPKALLRRLLAISLHVSADAVWPPLHDPVSSGQFSGVPLGCWSPWSATEQQQLAQLA